jgi:hypothetical protein
MAAVVGAGVEVEITEVVVVKGGRAAKDAIFFQMVTGTVGHKTSK